MNNIAIALSVAIIIVIILTIIYLYSVESYTNSINDAKVSSNKKQISDKYYTYAKAHEITPLEILANEPNINIVVNCITAYKNAYKYGKIESLYNIAHVYHYGIRNEGINIDKAVKYYVGSYIHPRTSNITRNNIIDQVCIILTDTENIQYANDFLRLPQLTDVHYTQIRNTVMIIRNEEPYTNEEYLYRHETIIPNIINYGVDQFLDAFNFNYQPPVNTLNGNYVVVQDNDVWEDNQNVHDPGVTNTMKHNISKIEGYAGAEYINEIYNLSTNNENAKRVLDTMVSTNAHLLKYDKHELEILEMVYGRIVSFPPEKRKNAEEVLVSQLANAVEHGSVVCATGRVNQVLATLDGIDNEFVSVNTKKIQEMTNKKQLHEQIMNKSAQITANTTLEDEELRTHIRSELKKEFVESGIMTEQELNSNIDTWIDGIA